MSDARRTSVGRIFISYRRTDTGLFCRRMATELKSYFGNDAVFFDEATALPGMEWPLELQDALRGSDAVLVVIGSRWLHAQDPATGQRRLDIEGDWVRQEVCCTRARARQAIACYPGAGG
jgi:hypothetical protein